MNAREHAQQASYVADQATVAYDDSRWERSEALAQLAQAHALTSLALTLTTGVVPVSDGAES